MKRFKFEMGGSYILYFGDTLGAAIEEFLRHRPNRIREVEQITEEPIKEYERP